MKIEKPRSQGRDRRLAGMGEILKRALNSAGEVLEDGIVGSKAQVAKAKREINGEGGLLKPGRTVVLKNSPDSAIVSVPPELRSDGTSQVVNGIILAGNTVFAVVITKLGEETIGVDLVETPYAHNKAFSADTNDLSPAFVPVSVDPRELQQTYTEGEFPMSKTVTIGRQLNENPDTTMSAVHFDFTVTAFGDVAVEDKGSLNGTTVLTADQFRKLSESGSLPTATEKLVADLASYPSKFDPTIEPSRPSAPLVRNRQI